MVHHYLEEEPKSPTSVMNPTFSAVIDPHPDTLAPPSSPAPLEPTQEEPVEKPTEKLLERSSSPFKPPPPLFTVGEEGPPVFMTPPPPPRKQPKPRPEPECCPFLEQNQVPHTTAQSLPMHITSHDMLTSLASAFGLGILTASIVAYIISKRVVEE